MSPAAAAPPKDSFARLGRVIEPVLNRVVLAGPRAVDLLINDSSVRVPRLKFAADLVFQLLSTSMIDRLGLDLQKTGFTRIGRGAGTDRWRHNDDITLDLVQVQTDAATPRQLCLEYATLLTHAVAAGEGHTIRAAAAPAVLALECASYAAGAARPLESEELERAVVLIAGRHEIEKECAAAPTELRTIITAALTALAASDALHLLVRRAIPESAMLPAIATRVRNRIIRMAC
jgi:hypothetical protein